jgi:hypothetical protein
MASDLRSAPQQVQGDGFIDLVTLAQDPRRNGMAIHVRREYDRVAERLDLQTGATWVKWRQALQGCE